MACFIINTVLAIYANQSVCSIISSYTFISNSGW